MIKNKLKKYRKEKNMSQTELAYKTGVSQRYIAFIEAGKRTPSLDLAKRISLILNKSVDNIVNCRMKLNVSVQ